MRSLLKQLKTLKHQEMSKFWLIFKREYITRVTSRSFLLGTLLAPLGMVVFIFVLWLIMSYQSDNETNIAIRDESGVLQERIKDGSNVFYTFSDLQLPELKKKVIAGEFDGIIDVPPIQNISQRNHTVYYYADNQLELNTMLSVQNQIADRIRDHKIEAFEMDAEMIGKLRTSVSIEPEPIDENSEDSTQLTTIIGTMLGFIIGFIIFMLVIFNGQMVMRSVMEEKMNRIVEVMISSVKPFHLMMGKILGAGAVGLTQVIIWMISFPLIGIGTRMVLGTSWSQMNDDMVNSGDVDLDDLPFDVESLFAELMNFDWLTILPLFLLYFLAGYLLYASLFAAVGSAIGDDLGEGQALTVPITIPLVISFYIALTAIRTPESSLAFWGSIIPFSSPMVMPGLLPFNPPWWQIALSIALLLGTLVFFVWVSARIYRVGILMYGKKASFKELWKWMFYKN